MPVTAWHRKQWAEGKFGSKVERLRHAHREIRHHHSSEVRWGGGACVAVQPDPSRDTDMQKS